MRDAWRIRDVRCAILGISWFWLMGAVYTTQLPTFTRLHLGGDAGVYTLLLALFSIGIGLGSVVCAKLSQGRLQLGMVLVGSVGMTLFGGDLALSALPHYRGELIGLADFLARAGSWRNMIDVALLGFFGGFFTVPLYTWLQTASPDDFRSQAVAANNIANGFYGGRRHRQRAGAEVLRQHRHPAAGHRRAQHPGHPAPAERRAGDLAPANGLAARVAG